MTAEQEKEARKSSRREAISKWVEENAVIGIEIEPPDRVDFMDGFEAGWNAAKECFSPLGEPCAGMDCFDNYQHGDQSPWKCPKCGTVWRVENHQWQRIAEDK